MVHSQKNTQALIIAGTLCAAFALGGCDNTDVPLPDRNSAEAHSLHERCLKILPPEQANELKQNSHPLYPSEFSKYNALMQKCIKLQNESPAP